MGRQIFVREVSVLYGFILTYRTVNQNLVMAQEAVIAEDTTRMVGILVEATWVAEAVTSITQVGKSMLETLSPHFQYLTKACVHY